MNWKKHREADLQQLLKGFCNPFFNFFRSLKCLQNVVNKHIQYLEPRFKKYPNQILLLCAHLIA